MNKRHVFEELKKTPKKVRFEKLCTIAEAFGFRLRGGKGSHRMIYVCDGVEELLNFSNVGGKAKPYPVRQLIKNSDNSNEEKDVLLFIFLK
jgi:hypothetical protein